MNNIWNSIAFRLSLVYGALVLLAVAMLSAIFYFGTIGVLEHGVDDKINQIMERLVQTHDNNQVAKKIEQALTDGIDSDTEIYLLTNGSGQKIAGNILMLSGSLPAAGMITENNVIRDGRPSGGRLLLHWLPEGSLLVVGRDMNDLNAVNAVILRAIIAGGALALILSIVGTIFFRSQIELKVGTIRRAALDIEAGNLRRRIPVTGESDEFARLSHDLNRMLDKIEHLMDGVKNVSNIIAHDLRTPLGRVRGHLDEALRNQAQTGNLADAGSFAIKEIDGIIVLLNKLLQIAEAESGTRRQSFAPVALRNIVTNLVELYDAAADDLCVTLTMEIEGNPVIYGDEQLLASAMANLLDNSLKYAGSPAEICVQASQRNGIVTLTVSDNGIGIPEQERMNVLQRFYRLEQSTDGYGIGLSIVDAIIKLHSGTLHLYDARPGLQVRMTFPGVV